jgi:putative polyhydroxyalkanoate system protein
MAKIHIKRRHALAHDEARQRLEEIASELKKKLKADYAWKGDSLQFKRSGASGRIDLSDQVIDINIKLGMVLAPMKGKIEATIKEKLDLALHGKDPSKLA